MRSARKLIYKIIKPSLYFTCFSGVFLALPAPGLAQQPAVNAYGLKVIKSCREFEKTVQENPLNAMWPLNTRVPQVMIELKYAGLDNFMKQSLYNSAHTTYLRKEAVVALAKVQQALLEKGLGLKIWDAYRPYSVTEKMWEPVKDERYAANPKYGSGHNRGAAVDLTIIDMATRKELNMGTAFDHFSDTAHVSFTGLPEEVLANRRLLQSLMEANGFKVLDTEWWHFYLPDAKNYDLLDLNFKQLRKINQRSSN